MNTSRIRHAADGNHNFRRIQLSFVLVGFLIFYTEILQATVSASSEAQTPSLKYMNSLTRLLEKDHAVLPLQVLHKINRDLSICDKQQADSILSSYTLFDIEINPESRIKLKPGRVHPELCTGKASRFLVRIVNESGMTAPLRLHTDVDQGASYKSIDLELQDASGTEVTPFLHGTTVEYAILRVLCTRPGLYDITLNLDAGQGTQDIAFRSEIPILFRCSLPAQRKLKNTTNQLRKKVEKESR